MKYYTSQRLLYAHSNRRHLSSRCKNVNEIDHDASYTHQLYEPENQVLNSSHLFQNTIHSGLPLTINPVRMIFFLQLTRDVPEVFARLRAYISAISRPQ
jgi:hypothetical protein